MKTVILQKMKLENFKGLSSYEVNFGSSLTTIQGANGTGKTTLIDAYLWVLTGKDSMGSESFKVQPVDQNNVTIPKLVTKVELDMEIDGEYVTFARQLSQKWSKPRGTNEEILKGNESTYYINGVPMTQTEYTANVKKMVCESEDFKLMSSITHFFSLSVNEKRRKLMEMAGEMPDILTEESYPHLYKKYVIAKSVDGVKKSASLALSELNKRKLEIPSKMSENERNMPTGVDFDELRANEKRINEMIADIDTMLLNDSNAKKDLYDKIDEMNKKRMALRSQQDAIVMEYKSKAMNFLSEYNNELARMNGELKNEQIMLSNIKSNLLNAERAVEIHKSKVNELGEQWKKVNSETFDGTVEEACPVCKRPFSKEEINDAMNELVKAFNNGKVGKLKTIVDLGNNAKAMLDDAKKTVEEYRSQLDVAEAKVSSLQKKIDDYKAQIPQMPDYSSEAKADEDYKAKDATIAMFDAKIEEVKSMLSASSNVDELRSQKSSLQAELRNVIRELSLEAMVAVVNKRRGELQEEAKKIAIEIAEQEQILFEIKQYIKAHITMVEDKVSSMFSLVRFQMYEPNLTNDGEREICECLVNGVPYSSNLNSAAKVNAGIDIVSAISFWKGVYVPLFIDNKETVTNLLSIPTQVVTLEVSNCNLSVVNTK